jgi:hypothetical protein
MNGLYVDVGLWAESDPLRTSATVRQSRARDWYRSPSYQNANRHQYAGAEYAAVIIESSKPRPAHSVSD